MLVYIFSCLFTFSVVCLHFQLFCLYFQLFVYNFSCLFTFVSCFVYIFSCLFTFLSAVCLQFEFSRQKPCFPMTFLSLQMLQHFNCNMRTFQFSAILQWIVPNSHFKLCCSLRKWRGCVILQWIVPKLGGQSFKFHGKVERLRDFAVNCSKFTFQTLLFFEKVERLRDSAVKCSEIVRSNFAVSW